MSHRLTAIKGRRSLLAAALLTTTLALATGSTGAAASPAASFTASKALQRTKIENGQSVVVDNYRFHVSVDKTSDLRNRQEISVSWTGAHPTGGIATDEASSQASTEEYPVVVMMCRGTPAKITPRTCWTATPAERAQSDNNFYFPPYRIDQYAPAADRRASVGVPSPVPDACNRAGATNGVQHWVPFDAAGGQRFGYGPIGCAGLPPEATINDGATPSNTVYADTHLNGTGRTDFVITTDESNASLGCSQKDACSLVVEPIVGVSCDPEAFGLPAEDQPPTPSAVQQAKDDCETDGNYAPGSLAPASPFNALAVSGQLWWSASNWRNRVAVPLSFASPDDVCNIVSSSAPEAVYGSPLMTQASIQWQPYFCTRSDLFNLKHVITSEPEAKNLLRTGSINAAFQGAPPETPFNRPVVQAPTAFTGWGVVFKIDDAKGFQTFDLKLNARLLAKLLTESYPSNPSLRSEYTALHDNPVDLALDPEFQALNPGLPTLVRVSEAASTILTLSADSDTTWALTSYIHADPEARAWLDGKPDPWGMVVNPAYKGIKLPLTSVPLLDSYSPDAFYSNNPCLRPSDSTQKALPYLPLVASPLQSQATITLNLQYDISSSQINCNPNPPVRLAPLGRESPGTRFLLGITSLADAERYALPVASLQTSADASAAGGSKFTSADGRSFLGPSQAAMVAAARSLTWSQSGKSWVLPYDGLSKTSLGRASYPGAMLLSTDVPTTGLSQSDARNYSKFLTFAAGAGQHGGFGTADLPPGYLPMSEAYFHNQLAYTKAAAIAVAAQDGQVPTKTGALAGAPAGSRGQGGSGNGDASGGTGTGSGAGSGAGTGAGAGAGGGSVPGSGSNTNVPGPSTSPSATASSPRGITSALSAASWTGAAFPLLAVLALLGLVVTLVATLRRPSQ